MRKAVSPCSDTLTLYEFCGKILAIIRPQPVYTEAAVRDQIYENGEMNHGKNQDS